MEWSDEDSCERGVFAEAFDYKSKRSTILLSSAFCLCDGMLFGCFCLNRLGGWELRSPRGC